MGINRAIDITADQRKTVLSLLGKHLPNTAAWVYGSRAKWTVAEAKARLSEILRLAEEEGPQRIGARKSFVVVPERVWQARLSPRRPLG